MPRMVFGLSDWGGGVSRRHANSIRYSVGSLTGRPCGSTMCSLNREIRRTANCGGTSLVSEYFNTLRFPEAQLGTIKMTNRAATVWDTAWRADIRGRPPLWSRLGVSKGTDEPRATGALRVRAMSVRHGGRNLILWYPRAPGSRPDAVLDFRGFTCAG